MPTIPTLPTGGFQDPRELSESTQSFAMCTWGLMQMDLNYGSEDIIHPRAKVALDELLAAGLIEKTTDPRGPVSFRASKAFDAARKLLKLPTDLIVDPIPYRKKPLY
jgi:hypothetical protein